MGYEHREDLVGGGGAGNGKHTYTHTHTHIHTHSVPRDKHSRWRLGGVWDDILTHVGVARPQIKLIGYEHREDKVGGEGSRQRQTHKNTHTHTVSILIHRVAGASAADRTQF